MAAGESEGSRIEPTQQKPAFITGAEEVSHYLWVGSSTFPGCRADVRSNWLPIVDIAGSGQNARHRRVQIGRTLVYPSIHVQPACGKTGITQFDCQRAQQRRPAQGWPVFD